jgi:hypothetical protein
MIIFPKERNPFLTVTEEELDHNIKEATRVLSGCKDDPSDEMSLREYMLDKMKD